MGLDWASKVGDTAGTWRLDSLISACEGRVDYAGTGNGKRAWVQLLPRREETRATRQSWELARQLSHDHLITLYDCGETEVDGALVDYAAFEHPDDTVGEILTGRLLDIDEARAMTSSAASALAYLHEKSLRHGAVIAPNMFIVGEAVKLGVDMIAAADGGSRESDLKQLGATLVEAMAGTTSPDAARRLPKPFRAIAFGCLEPERRHWTADSVLEVLAGRSKSTFDFDPVLQPIRRAWETLAGRRRWVIAGVAGLALAGVLLYRSVNRPPKAVTEPVTVVAPAPRPSPATRQPAPVSIEGASARKKPETPSASRGSWAVIAAAYRSYGSAQSRAQQIARKAPRLRPRVYPPAGRGNLYYVVLGSGMTQREAEVLRRNARQAGAPRDTYVTILKES
jgi:SPOR domain